MTNKNVELCPGFGELAKGIAPYSGEKFNDPSTIARNSDPVYGPEEAHTSEQDDSSIDTQPGTY